MNMSKQIKSKVTTTRMHSSRMRTDRSWTVCRGVLLARGGGFSLPGVGGFSLPGGVLPPVNRITHTCKNITFATGKNTQMFLVNNNYYEKVMLKEIALIKEIYQ